MKKVQVLGAGCSKCQSLIANAEEAASAAGVSLEIEKVQDINEILSFGVLTTPALVVDGQIVSTGKVLSPAEIREFM